MTQQVSRQIALMAVFTTCILLIALILIVGFNGDTGTAMSQAAPLAVILGGALTFLVADSAR
ncbi:MAG TPA: hypothetical protein VFV93_08825 [Thermomicrobiales bacterium]|nr:hypothetical protein [Thermomicrobiales bacterium]